MADDALGQPLGRHLDRGVETVTAKGQRPTKEVFALAKSNPIVLGSVAVLSGVLSKRQNHHPEITFFRTNREPVNVARRAGTLEIPIADSNAVCRITGRLEPEDGINGGGVEVIGEEVGAVVVHGRHPLRGLFLPILVDLNHVDDQVRVSRGTNALREDLDPKHLPGLHRELENVLVTAILQGAGDITRHLDLLSLLSRVVGLGLDGHRTGPKIDRHGVGDPVVGLECIFESVESGADRFDTNPGERQVGGALGNGDLHDKLLQFPTIENNSGRLTTGKIPAVQRERPGRSRNTCGRLHEINVRSCMRRQQVGVSHTTGKTLVVDLDEVLTVGRKSDVADGIVANLASSKRQLANASIDTAEDLADGMQRRINPGRLTVDNHPLPLLADEFQVIDIGGAVDLSEDGLPQSKLIGFLEAVVALGFPDDLTAGDRKRHRVAGPEQPGHAGVIKSRGDVLGDCHHKGVGHRGLLAARLSGLLHGSDAGVREAHHTDLIEVGPCHGHFNGDSDLANRRSDRSQSGAWQLAPGRGTHQCHHEGNQ